MDVLPHRRLPVNDATMASLVIVTLVIVTSGAGYLVGAWKGRLSSSELRDAVRMVLESLGCSALFFTVNVVTWVVVLAVARALTGWFVSAYLFGAATVGILSLLQGLLFRAWWESPPSSNVRRRSRST